MANLRAAISLPDLFASFAPLRLGVKTTFVRVDIRVSHNLGIGWSWLFITYPEWSCTVPTRHQTDGATVLTVFCRP